MDFFVKYQDYEPDVIEFYNSDIKEYQEELRNVGETPSFNLIPAHSSANANSSLLIWTPK